MRIQLEQWKDYFVISLQVSVVMILEIMVVMKLLSAFKFSPSPSLPSSFLLLYISLDLLPSLSSCKLQFVCLR
jgi:hypothetical protein